jgi:hypothetical protein
MLHIKKNWLLISIQNTRQQGNVLNQQLSKVLAYIGDPQLLLKQWI